jgi:hypothetical protein
MKLSLVRSALVTLLTVALMTGPVVAGLRAATQLNTAIDATAPRNRGAITGTAWHSDDTPVSNARLRLRSVGSGEVVMRTEADPAGRFTFVPVEPGVYIVELVDDDASVLGVSQMFGVGADETVATFIRLGTRVPWYSGFFTNAAAAALAAAASLGVTAVGDGGQPASARN